MFEEEYKERLQLGNRVKIEQAQIELPLDSDVSEDMVSRSMSLPALPKQTLYETVDKYVKGSVPRFGACSGL